MNYIYNDNIFNKGNKFDNNDKFNVNYSIKSKFFTPELVKNKKDTINKIKRLISNFNETTFLDDFSLIVMIKIIIKNCCVQKFDNFI